MDPAWHLARSANPTGVGVLVVHGSSGRVEATRADLLAAYGATALAIRWFGGPGQSAGPWDVPLEAFSEALDLIAPECDRLAIVGTSFGAEAALLTAALDPRVLVTAAFAPTHVVWPGYDESERRTSHWTLGGEPVPYVPLLEDWEPDSDPPAFRDLYAASVAAAPAEAEAATIPVERIGGELILVAGGDDRVWPAADFAERIVERRTAHGLATTVVTHPAAGHHALLPSEETPVGGVRMQRGGSPEASAELGALAWRHLVSAMGLRP